MIDLGTNDMRVIKTNNSAMAQKFTNETVSFMHSVVTRYNKPDITFFLSTGPMENTTMLATQNAVAKAKAEGLKCVWIDMRTACVGARLHASDDSDHCDGCAGHPGIEGHRGMFEAAKPVIAAAMGWGTPQPTPSPPSPPAHPVVACADLKAVSGYTCHTGYCAGDGDRVSDADTTHKNVQCGKFMEEASFPTCSSPKSGSENQCALLAAAKCSATAGCKSFGLSPLVGVEHAFLFNTGVGGLVPNTGWNIWVKDGTE